MCQSLACQGEISRNRYLNAVNWFEAIPAFYLPDQTLIAREIIQQAATCASEVFHQNGIEISQNRLQQLFAPLNAPSLAMRLRSAISYIRQRFGPTALPVEAEGLVSRITAIRGTLSHGNNEISIADIREFYKLTLLVEAVCGLLSLSGLAWDFERLTKAYHHPLQTAIQALMHIDTERASSTTEGA
jgi:hypothetical protein